LAAIRMPFLLLPIDMALSSQSWCIKRHKHLPGSALTFEDGDISVFQAVAARREGDHGLPVDRHEPIGTEALV
jgi:hypothetical protein